MNLKTQYNTLLITGGAGFVGSNLAVSFKKKYPDLNVIALDNLKRRGSELNITRLKKNNVLFRHGDIRNLEDLELCETIDLLIECSAEPSVLAGVDGSPAYLLNTNLTGTLNCLEFARKTSADIVFLSTSRVYAYDAVNAIDYYETDSRFKWSNSQSNKYPGWSQCGIGVDFPLNGPKSLYGATKLCSEILLQEYITTYGIRGVVNRCGVIAGPWQFGRVDQGVFALWMLAHYFKRNLAYIGFGGGGKQVRDLLHVNDLFDLLDLQISNMDLANGKVYNVGGGAFASLSLCETTRLCEEITGNTIHLGSNPDCRPADIRIYISDNSIAGLDFSWRPQRTAATILEDIYDWIRGDEETLKAIL